MTERTSVAAATHEYRQSKTRLIALLVIESLIALYLWFTLLGRYLDVLILVALIALVLSYFFQHITIDTNTVTLTTGLLAQNTTEIPLTKINTVMVKRGLFGRAFNYGNLVIFTGNDSSGIKFRGLDRPDEVKRLLKV